MYRGYHSCNEIYQFTPLADLSQSVEIDRLAIESHNLSAEVLMESAGALSTGEIFEYLKKYKQKNIKSSAILILCGPGHNGGDGLVVARHLLSKNIPVVVFCSDKENSPLVEKQKDRLRAIGATLHSIEDQENLKKIKCEIIVDALFGIGLNKDITGLYAHLIQWINEEGKPVISLDTPSGLNVDTGQIKGEAVKANLTLSFGLAKPGFYQQEGPVHVGQLKVLSIGFPFSLLQAVACTHFLIDRKWVSEKLPERSHVAHKAKHGHLLVLAGSEGFWGAGQLAALSAYRMGAGYVTLSPAMPKEFSSQWYPDILTQALSDQNLFKNKTAVAIGPGFGLDKKTKDILEILKKTKLPVVVDADAFTVCIKEKLFPLPDHWLVTPHSGELARLFGITGKEIDQNRCSYAMMASQKIGCLILLKGFYSLLAKKDQCWIIPTGNSALAKAGTGDVLTGFIGALMARSLDTFSAGGVAAFIHGLLAEEWVESGKDKDSLMAQDLKDILPIVLKKLRSVS